MAFPINRPRRLRRTETLRRMIRETRLAPDDLIQPFFVCPGRDVKRPIGSMPGVAQMSVDNIVAEARDTWAAGVPAVILFGIPERKDADGSEAWNDNGEVQRAIREIKERVPGMAVITPRVGNRLFNARTAFGTRPCGFHASAASSDFKS